MAVLGISTTGRTLEVSGQGFRLGGGFFKNLGWHLSHGDVKFERGSLGATAPTIDLPMSAHEFDFRMCRDVQQHRMLCAIKLLRKRCDWLGTPGRAIA